MDKDINEVEYGVKSISYRYFNGKGWITLPSSTTRLVSRFYKVFRRGGKTANFLNYKKRQKPLPVNNLQYTFEDRRGLYGTLRYSTPSYEEVSSGLIEPPTGTPGLPPDKALERLEFDLLTKFYERLADQKVNLAQVYAERDQTARLIGDTAIHLANAIKNVRKGDVAGALGSLLGDPVRKGQNTRTRKNKSVRYSSQKWLEIQYGWKPLLADCFGAAEQLAKSNINLPPPEHVSSVRRIPLEAYRTIRNPGTGLVTHEFDSGYYEKRVYATFVIAGEKYMLNSVGLANPAALAWELLPYSFVVDWFWSIGSWVNSFTATCGASFVVGGITTKHVAARTTTRIWTPGPGMYYSGSITGTSQSISVSRRALSDFPRVPFPPYNDTLSLEHMWNGIALLGAAFTKSK